MVDGRDVALHRLMNMDLSGIYDLDKVAERARALGLPEFICTGCGVHVTTFRWVNYRTIPPSMDERDLCERCKTMPDLITLPAAHPMRIAWEAYRTEDDYANSRKHACETPQKHIDGALWAAFCKGWNASHDERELRLHMLSLCDGDADKAVKAMAFLKGDK